MSACSVYFPAQGVLVGDGPRARRLDVVFGPFAADDGHHGRHVGVGLRVGRAFQFVVGRHHLFVSVGDLLAYAFKVGIGVERSGVAESAVGVVSLRDARVVEVESGRGLQVALCALQRLEPFVDDVLVHQSFPCDVLRQVDFILQQCHRGGRIVAGMFRHEPGGFFDGGVQFGEVARRAVHVVMVQCVGGFGQSFDFLRAEHTVVKPDVGHERLLQILVGREGRPAYPGVGHVFGEVGRVERHVRARAPLFAVQVKGAVGAVLGVEHVHPFPFLRRGADFNAVFVAPASGGVGEALCVEAVGREFSCRLGAGGFGGERPQEEARAGERGFVRHTVVHGDGVRVQPPEQVAGLRAQIQVAVAVAQVEHVAFAHFLHCGPVLERGRDAGSRLVRHGSAAGIVEIKMQSQSFLLSLEKLPAESREADGQQRL